MYCARSGIKAPTVLNPFTGSTQATPNPFPSVQPPPSTVAFLTNNWISFMPTATVPTYVWNIGLEQQLTEGLATRLAYVGTQGSHNFESIDINPTYNSGPNVGLRVYQVVAPAVNGTASKYAGQITQTQMEGNTQYHSLQATLQQRLRHGLSFLLNYTWSYAMDCRSTSASLALAPANSYVLPLYESTYRRLDHGASDFDHRNNLTLSYVWSTPS